MPAKLATRLEDFFQGQSEGSLRSIISYDQGDFQIEYIRDDVESRYDEVELVDAVDQSRFDTLSAPIYADVFAEDHGEITCLVACFENVAELNFVLDDGVGVAVGLDIGAFGEGALVGSAREMVLKERAER